MHTRVFTSKLRSAPSSRRGGYLVVTGRCVKCYARLPAPQDNNKRKRLMSNGKCNSTIFVMHVACVECIYVISVFIMFTIITKVEGHLSR